MSKLKRRSEVVKRSPARPVPVPDVGQLMSIEITSESPIPDELRPVVESFATESAVVGLPGRFGMALLKREGEEEELWLCHRFTPAEFGELVRSGVIRYVRGK